MPTSEKKIGPILEFLVARGLCETWIEQANLKWIDGKIGTKERVSLIRESISDFNQRVSELEEHIVIPEKIHGPIIRRESNKLRIADHGDTRG